MDYILYRAFTHCYCSLYIKNNFLVLSPNNFTFRNNVNPRIFYRPLSLALKAKLGIIRRMLPSGTIWFGIYSFFSWRLPVLISFLPTSFNFKVTETLGFTTKRKKSSLQLVSSRIIPMQQPLLLKVRSKALRARSVFFSFNRYWQIYKFAGDFSPSFVTSSFINNQSGCPHFSISRFNFFNPRSLQQKYKVTFSSYGQDSVQNLENFSSVILKVLLFFFACVLFFFCINFLLFAISLFYDLFYDSLALALDCNRRVFCVITLPDSLVFSYTTFVALLSNSLFIIKNEVSFLCLPLVHTGFFSEFFFLALEKTFKASPSDFLFFSYFLSLIQPEIPLAYFFVPFNLFFNFNFCSEFYPYFLDCVNVLRPNLYVDSLFAFLNILPRHVLSFELALPPLVFCNSIHLLAQLFEKILDILLNNSFYTALLFLILVPLFFCSLVTIFILLVRYMYFRYDPWNIIFLWVYSRDLDFLLLNQGSMSAFLNKNTRVGFETSSYLSNVNPSFSYKLNSLYSKEFEETFYGYSGFLEFAPSDDMLFNTQIFLQKFRSNLFLGGSLFGFTSFFEATSYLLNNISPRKNLKLASNFIHSVKYLYNNVKHYVFFENYKPQSIFFGGLLLMLGRLISCFQFLENFFQLNSKLKVSSAKKFTVNFLKEKIEGLVFSPVENFSSIASLADIKFLARLKKLPLNKFSSIRRRGGVFKPISPYKLQTNISDFGLEFSSALSPHELELNHYQISSDLNGNVGVEHARLFKLGFFEYLNEFSFWRRELNVDSHIEYPFWYQDFRAEQLTSIPFSNFSEMDSVGQSLKMVGAEGYQEEEDVVSEYLNEDSNLFDYSSTATLDWEGPVVDYGLMSEEDGDDPEDFFEYRYRLIDFVRQEYNKRLWWQTWLGVPMPRSSKILNTLEFSSTVEDKEEYENFYWKSFERSYSRDTDYMQDVNATDYSGDYNPRGAHYSSYLEGTFSTFYDDLVSAYYTNCNLLDYNVFCTSVYHRLFTTLVRTRRNTAFTESKTNFYSTRSLFFSKIYSINYSGLRFLKFFKQNAFLDYVSKSAGWRFPFLLLLLSLFFFFSVIVLFSVSLLVKSFLPLFAIYYFNSYFSAVYLLSFLTTLVLMFVPLFLFKQVLLSHLASPGFAFSTFPFLSFSFFILTGPLFILLQKLRFLVKKSNLLARRKMIGFAVGAPTTSHYISMLRLDFESTSIFMIRFSDFATSSSLPLLDNSVYNLVSANLNPYVFFFKFNLLSEQIIESYATPPYNDTEASFFSLSNRNLLIRTQASFFLYYLRLNMLSAPVSWRVVVPYESKFNSFLSLGGLFNFYYQAAPFSKLNFITYTFLTTMPSNSLGTFSWKFFSINSSVGSLYHTKFIENFSIFLKNVDSPLGTLNSFFSWNQNIGRNFEPSPLESYVNFREPSILLRLQPDSANLLSNLFYGLLDRPVHLKNVFKSEGSTFDSLGSYSSKSLASFGLSDVLSLQSKSLYTNKALTYSHFNSYVALPNSDLGNFYVKLREVLLGGGGSDLDRFFVSLMRGQFLGTRIYSFFEERKSSTPVSLPSLDIIYGKAITRSPFFDTLALSTTQARLLNFFEYDTTKLNYRSNTSLTEVYDERIFYHKFFIDQAVLDLRWRQFA